MQRFNNTYSNSVSPMTSRQQMMQNPGDWGAEISGSAAGMSMSQGYPEQRMGQGGMAPSNSAPMVAQGGGSTTLDMSNNQQEDVIMAPTTMEEVYKGSLKAMLRRNQGSYVVATFLVGTQSTVSWEGILYDVGNDYVTLYQQGRDRYVVCDIYSLKYIEFYDTRSREMCQEILRQNGWGETMPNG